MTRKRPIAETRKIDGKHYQLQERQSSMLPSSHSRKSSAEVAANKLRSRGFHVRVYRSPQDNQYRLYTRPAPVKRYASIADIRQQNKRAGGHWFSKDTMRFFNSKIESRKPIDGRFFISSEQYEDRRSGRRDARSYTVRVIDENGNIDTVGDFRGFKTKAAAIKAAKALSDDMKMRSRRRS